MCALPLSQDPILASKHVNMREMKCACLKRASSTCLVVVTELPSDILQDQYSHAMCVLLHAVVCARKRYVVLCGAWLSLVHEPYR